MRRVRRHPFALLVVFWGLSWWLASCPCSAQRVKFNVSLIFNNIYPQSMSVAVADILTDPRFPNVSLNLIIAEDTKNQVTGRKLDGVRWMLGSARGSVRTALGGNGNGNGDLYDYLAYIGDNAAATTIPLALAASNLKRVHIACATGGGTLADKKLYPYTFRSFMHDGMVAGVIYDIARAFGWRRIALLVSYDDVGFAIADSARSVFPPEFDIGFYYLRALSLSPSAAAYNLALDTILQAIKNAGYCIIFGHVTWVDAVPRIYVQNMHKPPYQWLSRNLCDTTVMTGLRSAGYRTFLNGHLCPLSAPPVYDKSPEGVAWMNIVTRVSKAQPSQINSMPWAAADRPGKIAACYESVYALASAAQSLIDDLARSGDTRLSGLQKAVDERFPDYMRNVSFVSPITSKTFKFIDQEAMAFVIFINPTTQPDGSLLRNEIVGYWSSSDHVLHFTKPVVWLDGSTDVPLDHVPDWPDNTELPLSISDSYVFLVLGYSFWCVLTALVAMPEWGEKTSPPVSTLRLPVLDATVTLSVSKRTLGSVTMACLAMSGFLSTGVPLQFIASLESTLTPPRFSRASWLTCIVWSVVLGLVVWLPVLLYAPDRSMSDAIEKREQSSRASKSRTDASKSGRSSPSPTPASGATGSEQNTARRSEKDKKEKRTQRTNAPRSRTCVQHLFACLAAELSQVTPFVVLMTVVWIAASTALSAMWVRSVVLPGYGPFARSDVALVFSGASYLSPLCLYAVNALTVLRPLTLRSRLRTFTVCVLVGLVQMTSLATAFNNHYCVYSRAVHYAQDAPSWQQDTIGVSDALLASASVAALLAFTYIYICLENDKMSLNTMKRGLVRIENQQISLERSIDKERLLVARMKVEHDLERVFLKLIASGLFRFTRTPDASMLADTFAVDDIQSALVLIARSSMARQESVQATCVSPVQRRPTSESHGHRASVTPGRKSDSLGAAAAGAHMRSLSRWQPPFISITTRAPEPSYARVMKARHRCFAERSPADVTYEDVVKFFIDEIRHAAQCDTPHAVPSLGELTSNPVGVELLKDFAASALPSDLRAHATHALFFVLDVRRAKQQSKKVCEKLMALVFELFLAPNAAYRLPVSTAAPHATAHQVAFPSRIALAIDVAQREAERWLEREVIVRFAADARGHAFVHFFGSNRASSSSSSGGNATSTLCALTDAVMTRVTKACQSQARAHRRSGSGSASASASVSTSESTAFTAPVASAPPASPIEPRVRRSPKQEEEHKSHPSSSLVVLVTPTPAANQSQPVFFP